MPETGIGSTIGQELLFHKVVFVVMGILIVLAIPQLRHQFGGCIAQVKRNRQITRLTDTTFEKKYDDVKKLYAASVGMYPDAVTEEKGIKVGDMNCTRYELYIPKTSNDKPLYTCYILIEHDAALYQILITATRDLREDFGEIEKILNSIQFK